MGELPCCSQNWYLVGNTASSRPWAFRPNLLLPSQEDGVNPVISLLSGNLPQWPLSSLPSPNKCPYIYSVDHVDLLRERYHEARHWSWGRAPLKEALRDRGSQRVRNQGSSGNRGWEAENDHQNREQETGRPGRADGKGWPMQQSGADTVAAWGLSVWSAACIQAQGFRCWLPQEGLDLFRQTQPLMLKLPHVFDATDTEEKTQPCGLAQWSDPEGSPDRLE